MNIMTKELTKEQVTENFLYHIKATCKYWSEVDDYTDLQKLEGLAHSILVMLDGGTYLPAFIVAPLPHKKDKQFNIKEGDDYYPQNHESKVNCDIAGNLHELFCKLK